MKIVLKKKFEKTLKSAPLNLSKCKLCGKKKELLNLGPKMLFSFFFWGGWGEEAVEGVEGGWNWKNLLLYKMSKLKFVKKVSFMLRNLRIYGQRYLI